MEKPDFRTYFDEKMDSQLPSTNLLPFFHSCDALLFKSIIIDGEIVPSDCDVFVGERLLYLFYGRPAYKNQSQMSSKLGAFFPTCFILSSDTIGKIKRIIPFDSGAFQKKLYDKYIHPKMTVEDFYLSPKMSSINKLISFFFSTNESYFSGKPKQNVTFDPLDFEIESYYELIKGIERNEVDDRKATIEIQLNKNLKLIKNRLKAIIIPEHFLSSELVENKIIKEMNAEAILPAP